MKGNKDSNNDRKIYFALNSRRGKKQAKIFVNTTSTKYVRHRKDKVNLGIIISAIIFALVISVSVAVIAMRPHDVPLPQTTSQEPLKTGRNETDEKFIKLILSNSDVHKGDLILVNYDNPYIFPPEPDNVTVYGNKSSSYKVSGDKLMLRRDIVSGLNVLMDDFFAATGCGDVLVNSAYRSYDEQLALYNERVALYGEEKAAEYVSKPGYSEHHTGMAVDFSVYTSDGKSYVFGTYDGAEWLRSHFCEYGYILRYPSDKTDITRIEYEGWHYRYVGRAHAMIMKYLDLCLEEYIEYLKSYTADGKYLTLLDDGDVSYMYAGNTLKCAYAVYYVPVSGGESTEILIPKDTEYDISGNNTDGFVVVLKRK